MRLIDADALVEVIRSNDYMLSDRYNSRDFGMFTVGIQQAVDQTPTLEQTVVLGEWVYSAYYGFSGREYGRYNCSECGCLSRGDGQENFCSNCGAKMKEEKV